jgi:hypothetical protein
MSFSRISGSALIFLGYLLFTSSAKQLKSSEWNAIDWKTIPPAKPGKPILSIF